MSEEFIESDFESLIEESSKNDDDENLEDIEVNIEDEEELELKDDEEDEEDDDEDLHILEIKEKVYKNTNNITVPFITKYEYPKIISIRAQQIAKGAPIYINIEQLKIKNPINIAELEFKSGKLNNMIIKRKLPNGNIELRKISELNFYEFY